MPDPIWIQTRYQSAYSLLGAMAGELADACRDAGLDARPIDPDARIDSGTLVFFNAPPGLDALPPALFAPGSGLHALQIFVDHPFALPAGVLDEWHGRNGLENLRLCLPCADDAHLIRMRFPGLRHAWVAHAIPRSALCDEASLAPDAWRARPFDVVAGGSIQTETAINSALSALPDAARRAARDAAEIMLRDPRIGFVQAFDLVGGPIGVTSGVWDSARAVWRVAVMLVNRARRVGAVRALQGLRVGVLGPDAWREHCTGTIRYLGDTPYERVGGAMASARIALAWGPTQFAHSYSERLMLGMASGCAALSDDRMLVRRDFPGLCGLYSAGDPVTARAACDRMLADHEASLTMIRRARAHAERACLWEHRLGALFPASALMPA